MDIVIEGNRIREIRSVGYPKVPIDPEGRPSDADARDRRRAACTCCPASSTCTGTSAAPTRARPAEYVYKLWLAHGVTTVREPGSGNGVDWTLRERERSAKQRDRRAAHLRLRLARQWDWDGGPINTPEEARAFVRSGREAAASRASRSSGGAGDLMLEPAILGALLDEARKQRPRLAPRTSRRWAWRA